jgi:hypothetical protein
MYRKGRVPVKVLVLDFIQVKGASRPIWQHALWVSLPILHRPCHSTVGKIGPSQGRLVAQV